MTTETPRHTDPKDHPRDLVTISQDQIDEWYQAAQSHNKNVPVWVLKETLAWLAEQLAHYATERPRT